MRKSKLLPLVLIFSVLSYTPVALAPNGEELFEKGNAAQAAGNYSQAETIFRQVIRINPQDANAYNGMGNALRKQGKLEEAITYYQKAIQLDPKYPNAYNGMGLALKDQGKLEAAITNYQKAIQLDPKSAIPYYNLGIALSDQGKVEEAITNYQKAIQLDPKFAYAYTNLGIALKDQGKVEEAITNYQKEIQLDPKSAIAYYNLGIALYDQGKLEEAITNYQKAIQLDPKSAIAYYNLGVALYDQGKLEEAITNYQKAIQLDPKDTYAYNGLGNALKDQGKVEEAITNYQKAIQLDPKFAIAYNNLGIVLSDQGKLEEAITNFRQVIQLDPKSAYAYNNLGLALSDQGKLEEAINNFTIALSLPDEKGIPASAHTLAHNNLGNALQQQGKLPEAIAEYQKSIALDGNYVTAQNNLKEAQRLLAQQSPQYVPPPASDLAFVPTLQQEPLRDELRATVLIIANDIPGTRGPTRGTGWVVKREGNTIWVMTNRHVIANQQRQPSPKIEIEFFSEIEATRRARFPATVEQISNDEKLDLAVLKITGIPDDIRPLKMGTGRVSRNTKVIVIGHPINADPWNSSGGEVTNYSINKVTVSAVVATGNSGGPVINETTKEVIGIMVRVADEDIATDPNTPTPAVPDQVFTTGGFGIAYPIDLVQQQLIKWGINP
ncbi:Tetratricopeptide TPR_2 repeat protein [Planktothrix serta PCC 8927]|uniref:Tetratricopeptide TPR_2 repeat protein n=1 Tax=Planktothrix serta PCC 8927 TaxID=671068 RepID=A0A7Z9C151_9CYAN|nr:serine protease [Planktothrix serta]VXD23376.1 Tetratricopeptide TPR_2 repeat protein [Planktothrix serta PCC 8927]